MPTEWDHLHPPLFFNQCDARSVRVIPPCGWPEGRRCEVPSLKSSLHRKNMCKSAHTCQESLPMCCWPSVFADLCICGFSFSLKFICNPQIKHDASAVSHSWTTAEWHEVGVFGCTYRRPRLKKAVLCPLVPALILLTSSLFTVYSVLRFWHFLCFLLMLKMVSKHSTQVLSNIFEKRKTVVCLTVKTMCAS